MRIAFTLIATLALSTPIVAQNESDPDRNVSGGVQVAGWQARLDRPTQQVDNLRLVAMGDGLHATTGPAAIFFAPENTGSDEYRVSATFTQTKLPEHQEAYGLFIGGAELLGGAQAVHVFPHQAGRQVPHQAAGRRKHAERRELDGARVDSATRRSGTADEQPHRSGGVGQRSISRQWHRTRP